MDKRIILKFFVVVFIVLTVLFSYKITLRLTDLNGNQQETINFLNGEEMNLEYSTEEYSHLIDVRNVMVKADYVFYFCLLFVSLVLTYYKKDMKKMLKYSGSGVLVILGIFLLFVFLDFNFIFVLFHKVFFPQGNWMFAIDSLLIRTFPLEFFIEFAKKMFFIAFIIGMVVIFISKKLEDRNKLKNN